MRAQAHPLEKGAWMAQQMPTLERELALLQRGRGLRAPELAAHVGPALRAALHLEDTASAAEVRDRVVAALRSAGSELPPDLRLTFLSACALEAAESGLLERLTGAGRLLDRDLRTVRRRLTQANTAVAVKLARGARPPLATDEAWYIEAMDSRMDFSSSEPYIRGRKTIVPTTSGLTRLSERISLPSTPGIGSPTPTIEVFEGGQLVEVRHQGSVWWYDIVLAKPFETGVPQTIGVAIRLPSRESMAPIAVMTPIRPCRLFTQRVDFGNPSVCDQVWLVDGEYPTELAEPPDASPDIPLGDDSVVVTSFSGLRAGLSYGIRWRWANDVLAKCHST